jgi:hypothetical protein
MVGQLGVVAAVLREEILGSERRLAHSAWPGDLFFGAPGRATRRQASKMLAFRAGGLSAHAGVGRSSCEFEIRFHRSRCHAAATLRGLARDLEGRTGKRLRRKPAWSLQDREMVDDLGSRR